MDANLDMKRVVSEMPAAGDPMSDARSTGRRPDLHALQHFDRREGSQALPPIHGMAASTVSRDRWERLETTIEVPETCETVWRALTNPECLEKWFAVTIGAMLRTDRDLVLDFEDGEYFLVRPVEVEAPHKLRYYARWLGIGQPTSVLWQIDRSSTGTRITVIEEASNPPRDWQTWHGGGWPGILEQLAAYLRTGMNWRWPWRRTGPYVQIELPVPVYPAWDALFATSGLKYWLIARGGEIAAGCTLPILMGDASGSLEMTVDQVVAPGQDAPSFLPHVAYRLRRPVWGSEIGGRVWLEPAGWGQCLLQAFHYNWEALPGDLQKSERRILTNYWADCARRAQQILPFSPRPASPHNW
jgi:uncharacterized protein YndB with AHSA1/START domain